MRLLTFPPSAGYQQTPLSVYFCYDARLPPAQPSGAPRQAAPRVALAEVTNTPWGERVRFAFTLGDESSPDVVPKPMHVSPFFAMNLFWRIAGSPPGDSLRLSFSSHAAPEGGSASPCLFLASLKLRRVAPPDCPQAWAWLMPHRVALGIYWHALLLLWKGVRFQPHPKYEHGEGYRREAARAEAALGRGGKGGGRRKSGGGECPVFAHYREADGAPWSWS